MAYLRFVSQKHKLQIADNVADVSSEAIDKLPIESRRILRRLYEEHGAAKKAIEAAQPGHVDELLQLAARAWRRPLAAREQAELREFYAELRGRAGLDHRDAVRAMIVRVLMSPDFLYRLEPPISNQRDSKAIPLSDWQLATRLSYFLWSSLPDDELRRAAAAGELQNRDELARQARRMLRDEKARRLAAEFFGQWFGFYRFDRFRGVDANRFPEFSDKLKGAMHEEAVAFFEYIVREDRDVDEMLLADYAFVNRELAEHYQLGAKGPLSDEIQRVDAVRGSHRGGLMGLGAVLTVTSAPRRTSPVKRGDWILRRVLGTPVPPPPADAGSIPADDVTGDGLTLRKRLEAHRRDATCANCHARIDPLGFALEGFDAVGRRRETYRDGQPIDEIGTLQGGAAVQGEEGLRDYLADNIGKFHRTLSTKLVGFALGRGESVADAALIDRMTSGLQHGNQHFSALVEQIVVSKQFRYQRTTSARETP